MIPTILWVLQWMVNLTFISFAAYLWWRGRGGVKAQESDRFAAYVNTLEARASQWEGEAGKYRIQLEAQIKCLLRICDQAQTILEKGRQEAALPATQEERELRELSRAPESTLRVLIPTLQEVERTRERLRCDTSLDLRSVLKDQLA